MSYRNTTPKTTTEFENTIASIGTVPRMTKGDGERIANILTNAGYYFEYLIFKGLSVKAVQSTFTDQFRTYAQKVFTNPASVGVIGGAYWTGELTNYYDAQGLIEMGKAFEKLAAEMVDNFLDFLGDRELNIVTEDVEKAIVGDLKAMIDGEEVIIEIKTQYAGAVPVKWFTLIDKTLFGQDGFAAYVAERRDSNPPMWGHKYKIDTWRAIVSKQGWQKFIEEKIGARGNNREFLHYMLQKGEGIKAVAPPRRKIVMHAHVTENKASVTLDLSTIFGRMPPAESIAHKFIEKSNQIQAVWYDKSEPSDDGNIGTLGLQKFGKGPLPDAPEKASFDYKMYIAQKYFI